MSDGDAGRDHTPVTTEVEIRGALTDMFSGGGHGPSRAITCTHHGREGHAFAVADLLDELASRIRAAAIASQARNN